MQVKHNHNCSLCNTQKTCFVFDEFNILFSLCRSCYDKLLSDLHTYDVVETECSFCEKNRTCRAISGFPDSMFFVELNMCGECLNKIQDRVDKHPEI